MHTNPNTKEANMDKLNYTLKGEEIQEIKQKIREIKREVVKLIKKANVLRRKRIIKKPSTLVQAAILYIVEKLSFQRLSDVMAAKYGISMSDTAWKKQITKIAPVFYEVMMTYLNHKSKEAESNNILGYSSYAIDATDISLEGKTGTILRAHTVYSLSKKAYFKAHIADIHTGESVKLHTVKANNLYFADRAYGKTPQMEYMLANNAEFVFRFSPSQVKLFKDLDCTEKIDFKSYLSNSNTASSIYCFFKGKKSVYKIRVIISPIPKEKAENAAIKAKKKSVKKQNKLSKDTLTYAKWLFLATSLSYTIHPEEIVSAYRKRWQIELHFKRSKSLLRFHRLRHCSYDYAFSIVSIWLAVTAFVYSILNTLSSLIFLDISTFNAFSLFAFFIS